VQCALQITSQGFGERRVPGRPRGSVGGVNIIILWNTLYINAALEHSPARDLPSGPKTWPDFRRWCSTTSIYWTICVLGSGFSSAGPAPTPPESHRCSGRCRLRGSERQNLQNSRCLNPVFRSIDPNTQALSLSNATSALNRLHHLQISPMKKKSSPILGDAVNLRQLAF
jgi:hypothetical protein